MKERKAYQVFPKTGAASVYAIHIYLDNLDIINLCERQNIAVSNFPSSLT